ncbi:MAG: SRPBCC family protein [Acidimicrobiia bacterium]|nr:SRPBCC family protein [Acidimicrobiia bacterium]
MARYVTTVRTPRRPDEAFTYMADLRNFAEWDPGVRAVEQIDGDGGGPRASFDVTVAGIGRDLTLRYVTEEHDAPTRVLVEARSSMFTSIDLITVEPDGDGALVTYDAELKLNGVLGIADPLLRPAFSRIGDRAAAGLREVLEGTTVHP